MEEEENMAIKRKVEKAFYIHQAIVPVSCTQHFDHQVTDSALSLEFSPFLFEETLLSYKTRVYMYMRLLTKKINVSNISMVFNNIFNINDPMSV